MATVRNMTEPRTEIERILAGDKGAFEEFVRRYQRLVSHIVFRMIPRQADHEDICQDVFLRIYQNLAGFRGDSKTSTWVGRVTHNYCLNWREKKRELLFDDIDQDGPVADPADCDRQTPLEAAERSDLSLRLRKEIGRLAAPYRTVLALYHLDEMSYAEIGQIMNMPDGTVKSYLFRARGMLRERLTARYKREDL